MTSSVAPYEQLVRQVEALKAENSHLRQELRDNSSHLSKLETETSGMKVRQGAGRGTGANARAQRPTQRWIDRPGPGQPGTGTMPTRAAPCPHLQEVLKHLQGKLEQEARMLVSSGQTEVLEQLKGEGPGWGPPVHPGATPCAPTESREEEGRGRADRPLSLHSHQPCRWTSPACTT